MGCWPEPLIEHSSETRISDSWTRTIVETGNDKNHEWRKVELPDQGQKQKPDLHSEKDDPTLSLRFAAACNKFKDVP